MSFRLAAYGVCIKDGRVLLAHYMPPGGDASWTLPGGRVEQGTQPASGHVVPVQVGGLIQH
ncbi:MAG TPA: hypothetical protein VF979_11230 [Streptosporangiaceae bacterium]